MLLLRTIVILHCYNRNTKTDVNTITNTTSTTYTTITNTTTITNNNNNNIVPFIYSLLLSFYT